MHRSLAGRFAQIWHSTGRLRGNAKLLLVARLVISGLLVAVALWAADSGQVFRTMARVQFGPLIAAMAGLVVAIVLACVRWKLILNQMDIALPLATVTRLWFRAALLGLMLPSSASSDIMRAALLRRLGVNWAIIGASIYLDRLYGLVAVGIAGMPGLLIAVAKDILPPGTALFFGIILLLPVIVLTTAILLSGRLQVISTDQANLRIRILRMIRETGRCVQLGISSGRSFGTCVLFSLISQTVNILSASLLGAACQINVPLEVYFVFTPLIWLASLMPISVSGIGLREVGFGILFRATGLPFEHGMILGVLLSATTVGTIIAGGVLSMAGPLDNRLDRRA
jgi:uncharacterized membrane protein YbhN (UPF0104 family)